MEKILFAKKQAKPWNTLGYCIGSILTNNYKDMNKKEVIKMAEKYSGRTISQVDYMAGFQAACNIVRQKLETCYNEDFCDAMEELAQVAYMDLSDDD